MRYNEVNSEHLGELNIISNIQDDDINAYRYR